MPKQTTSNQVNLFEVEDVLSFFTFSKKNHFDSESKLYGSLVSAMIRINTNYLVHLTTYPYIAVHVSCGLAGGLINDKAKIEQAIKEALESHLKET